MVDLTLGTILAQMLNFFILVWILKRFAYQPLVDTMNERKTRIANDLANAEQARLEAEQLKVEYAQQMTLARQEAQEIVEKAHHQAQVASTEELAAARAHIESEKSELVRILRMNAIEQC